MDSKFEFFYGGPFSQWYSSPIIIENVKYNCAEQYMMAMKAVTFKDWASFLDIMKAKEPWEQKALGKTVRNFNKDEWEKVAKDFVFKANYVKFSTPEMKQFIISTGDRELVEASPTDCIWGIGLSEDDPKRCNKSEWRGTNWLGEVLMEVRNTFKKELING